ncbi:ecdysteroid-regulated 16 kDa protein-like [Clytia hemisphaerica]|uniref:ecdysteroid-regulated 16 kDa protein-like n=1 Tax=Clytia hemisphaerica TaxID=252671 RepID=UPI0034D69193
MYCLMCTLVVLTIAGTSHAVSPVYELCKDKNAGTAKVDEISIDPCEDPKQCVFNGGQKVSVKLSFTPTSRHEKITTEVYGMVQSPILGEITVPAPSVGCRDACQKGCGVSCPLLPNKQQHLTLLFDVEKHWPQIEGRVGIQLKDSKTNEALVCLSFNVKLS